MLKIIHHNYFGCYSQHTTTYLKINNSLISQTHVIPAQPESLGIANRFPTTEHDRLFFLFTVYCLLSAESSFGELESLPGALLTVFFPLFLTRIPC